MPLSRLSFVKLCSTNGLFVRVRRVDVEKSGEDVLFAEVEEDAGAGNGNDSSSLFT